MFGSQDITVLYPHLPYSEACYEVEVLMLYGCFSSMIKV